MYKNIIWDLLGKFGIQIVSFILSIILTRLLTPTEYGIMGMVMVVVTFAHIFLDLGFNRAIIQRSNVSQLQYSTIFFINTGMALLLTLVCFLSAGALSDFYEQQLIKPVFQAASLSFLLNGLNLIPSSILYKRMHFKINSIQSLVSAIISGVIGVAMAYQGFGVWALLSQSLIGSFVLLILNWLYVRWWPSFQFSITAIKPMWAYGSRLFASGILDTLYTRMDTFIVAKIFSPATLGFYSRAQSMDNMVKQFSAGSIVSALFPYIAKHQHDKPYLRELYKKYLHIITFVSVGISGALFLIAKDLFVLLFTDRWVYAAELFQIMAIMGFAWPASSLMCAIISGVGNSKAFFRLELIKKALLLPVYLFGFFWGLKGFIIFMCVSVYGAVAVNAIYVRKEINLSVVMQLKVIGSYLFIALDSAILTYIIMNLMPRQALHVNIFITGALFSILYISAIYLLKLPGAQVVQLSLKRFKVAL